MVVISPLAASSPSSGPSHTVVAIAVTSSIVALLAIVFGSIMLIRRQRRAGRIELPASPSSIGAAKSHWSADMTGTSPRSFGQLGVPSTLDADTVVGPYSRPSSSS